MEVALNQVLLTSWSNFREWTCPFGIRLALNAGDFWLNAAAPGFLPMWVVRWARTLCTLSHGQVSSWVQYCGTVDWFSAEEVSHRSVNSNGVIHG